MAKIKNPLSTARRTAIKGRAKTTYAGKGRGSVYARAKVAAKKGKKLSDIAGSKGKTGWATGANKGKGVVKKADLATSKTTGKKATDLTKKFAGNPAKLARAQKARTLARQAARKRHAQAVTAGRKASRA